MVCDARDVAEENEIDDMVGYIYSCERRSSLQTGHVVYFVSILRWQYGGFKEKTIFLFCINNIQYINKNN